MKKDRESHPAIYKTIVRFTRESGVPIVAPISFLILAHQLANPEIFNVPYFANIFFDLGCAAFYEFLKTPFGHLKQSTKKLIELGTNSTVSKSNDSNATQNFLFELYKQLSNAKPEEVTEALEYLKIQFPKEVNSIYEASKQIEPKLDPNQKEILKNFEIINAINAHTTEEHEKTRKVISELKTTLESTTNQRVSVEASYIIIGKMQPTRGIKGRETKVNGCISLLEQPDTGILWLHGMGGIGKSTIASKIFEHYSKLYSDANTLEIPIWYNVRFEMDAERLLTTLLQIHHLDNLAATALQPAFDRNLSRLVSKLYDKVYFIVFDNMESVMGKDGEPCKVEQPWKELLSRLAATPSSKIVVTSRALPTLSVQGCEFINIDGLDWPAALELFKAGGLKDSDKFLKERVWEPLVGHPMAINTLIAQVKRHRSWHNRLANAGGLLNAIRDSKDTDNNPLLLFDEIIKRLPENQKAILEALSTLYRPEIIETISTILSANGHDKVGKELESLIDQNLVQINIAGETEIYSLHSLIADSVENQNSNKNSLHERAYAYYVNRKSPGDRIMNLLEAAKHAKELKDLSKLSEVLYIERLAKKLDEMGRYDQAFEFHKSVFDMSSTSNDIERRILSAGWIGTCRFKMGVYSEAGDYLRIAINDAKSQQDHKNKNKWLLWLGRNYFAQGQYDNSIKTFEEVLTYSKAEMNKQLEGNCLGELGRTYRTLGNYRKALECVDGGLKIAQEAKDQIQQGRLLGIKGRILYYMGDYEKALPPSKEAFEIAAKEGGSPIDKGSRSSTIGDIYVRQGKWEEAMEKLNYALEQALDTPQPTYESAYHGSIGQVFLYQENYEEAVNELKKAIKIADEIGDPAGRSVWRSALAEAYLLQGLNKEAFDLCMEAKTIAEDSKHGPYKMMSYGMLGRVQTNLSDLITSQKNLEKALEMARKMPDKYHQAFWHRALGELFIKLDDFKMAQPHLEKALEIDQELGLTHFLESDRDILKRVRG